MTATPARAEDNRQASIDLPAGRLTDSLAILSRQTGISVGMGGHIPDVRTPRLKGHMRASAALARLLERSGLRAVETGPGSYRLEPAPRQIVAPQLDVDLPTVDIVVTAAKRAQDLATVPIAISVVELDEDRTVAPLPNARDIAARTDGLTITNLGPGRNRQFIRGVADSPFNGTSQSTVAVQVDDTRVTYDAPDPDLRLVDVARVEILKGPQGPLYGSGALGGVYHVVTRKPDLDDASASIELHGTAVASGAEGGGGHAVVNLPLVDERLAVRAVGYRDFEPGWIDNSDGRRDSNDTHVSGGRVALAWRPFDGWKLGLMGAIQQISQDDSQYVTRNGERLDRTSRFPEPSENDFKLASASLQGEIGAVDLLLASSFADQRIDTTLDASAVAEDFGLAAPLRYRDHRKYTVQNHEIRLSQENQHGISWIVGASWLHAENESSGVMFPQAQTAQSVVVVHHEISELAAFAELSLPLGRAWRITGGARAFHAVSHDERGGFAPGVDHRQGRVDVTPSLSLSWSPTPRQFWFLRFASAMRPGGLSSADPTGQASFTSDELMNFDFGWRLGLVPGRLSFDGAAYLTFWDRIQSDYLLSNGLLGIHNAGDGRILGIEGRLRWTPSAAWLFGLGVTAQSARLIKPDVAGIPDNSRLPVVPDITVRLEVARRFEIGDWHADLSARTNYLGAAHLGFDPGLNRDMGSYATVTTAASLSNDRWTLSARLENLFNARGDSFGLGNNFSLREGRQFTPLRPRTAIISLRTDL